MGGDLNLKKSWHPQLVSNQRRVWEEEQKALQERKIIAQLKKEREEERQVEELQQMQEAAGGKQRLKRVEWMYAGPSAGQTGTTEENESYLLGKRRIDSLLKDNITKQIEKSASMGSSAPLQDATNTSTFTSLRDTTSKVLNDPLLAMKRKEEEALEAMMKDTVKRKALMAASEKDVEHERSRKHRKHHHRRDRSRNRSRDDRDRAYSRRDSPPRSSEHRRRRRDRSRDSRDRIDSRRTSPPRSTEHHSHRRDRSRDRSRDGVRDGVRDRSRDTKDRSAPRRSSPRRSSPPRQTEDDRARRLAAMQEAASDLDHDRQNRLRLVAEKEETERRADDAARARSKKYGGQGNFLTAVNRRAGELAVGDRLSRGRVGYERDMD